MRTSRIARDTSRILTATTRSSSLRRARAATNPLNAVETRESESAVHHGAARSDSDLSSVPDDALTDTGDAIVGRKRKRGQPAPVAVKREVNEVEITAIASPKKESKPKKARRVPAKKITAKDGTVKVEPPPRWEEIYSLTREMRNENVAPVDTMGCESLADRATSPRDQRFQTLISLMLSSQTKDTVTAVAIKGMQERMPGGFNLESVIALEPQTLNAFINKVGFHNLKTKYIKNTAEILRDKFNSDIPDSIQGLTSLPGVGPKMAYLCMSAAWGRDEGIGVDVHVHRITNLWGWHKTTKPEDTRAALESWLPREKWHDINNLLVGFGQTICLPVGKKCGDCKLANRGLCPSAVVGKKIKVKDESLFVKTERNDASATSSARDPCGRSFPLCTSPRLVFTALKDHIQLSAHERNSCLAKARALCAWSPTSSSAAPSNAARLRKRHPQRQHLTLAPTDKYSLVLSPHLLTKPLILALNFLLQQVQADAMNVENATDNVWADASHDPPGENIASTVLPSQRTPIEPSVGSVEQAARIKDVADDDQPVEKSNLSTKIYQARKTVAVKVWRARYALLTVFGFLCWLVLTLLMIESAATGVRGVLMPSYRTTTHRLGSIKSEQSLLVSKFEDLQDIHLQKRPFETHLKCLTRAANVAQDHYGDLPYQSYPLVAEYTTRWAQSECDRIIFSPVLIPRSGWHHVWKALTDHAGAAFFRCKDVLDGLMRAKKQRSQKPSSNAQNTAFSLPLGHRLDCNDEESFCRLSVVPLGSFPTSGNLSSEEMKLISKRRRILQVINGCKHVRDLVAVVWWLIPWKNLMLIAVQIVNNESMARMGEIPYQKGLFRKIFRVSVVFWLAEAAVVWVFFWHQQFTSKDNFSRTITTITYAVHFGAILLCCVELAATWWARTLFFHRFLWAFRELRTAYSETPEEILRQYQVEYNGSSKSNNDVNPSDSVADLIDKQTVVVEGDGADDTSTFPDLHISPGSSLQEDVKLMREHLHRKQAKPKLETKALCPQGVVANSTGSEYSISPTSDSGWSVLTSSEDEAVMLQKMDDSPDDEELVDDATEAGNMDEEEQPTEDGREDNDD
ncbi:hypothetical protein P171DRAFT_468410 [Karstenula rhodostoma CBS 690.94]|uniref:Endonuclease III homolog n=1 Tax=Karstenula rhodostoma CBS 690.94 TaxID=1392251 RepID=A0A9P4PWZ9_9PLEO|nr:hypothetical protein P171DRAFT_468410 [Karstenula rhodostoma CBS 690.94]